jgi:hypothetical protein
MPVRHKLRLAIRDRGLNANTGGPLLSNPMSAMGD